MEWISVKDELPKTGHIERYPHCSDDVIATDGRKEKRAFFELGVWHDARTKNRFSKFEVTHWKHLPNTPKP